MILRVDHFFKPSKNANSLNCSPKKGYAANTAEENVRKLDLLNDIGMLDSFKQRDFADGGRWYAIVLFFKPDLFKGNELSGHCVSALVDNTIRALAKLF